MTKGFPFTGDVEDHEDDILGYKDGNEYYQWAVLKIVEKLLTHATEVVNLDLVMMDREFDSEGVKGICEEYGVYYLNPTRIFDRSEAETIAWMYRNGKRFHVTEEETDTNTPTRKQLYLPKRSNTDDEEDDGLSEVWQEMCGEWVFEDVEDEPSDGMSFSRTSVGRKRLKNESRKRKKETWTPPELSSSRRTIPT